MSKFDLKTTDLLKLNSLTKYPSIPTYHTLNQSDKGRLSEDLTHIFTSDVYGREKVDGTNARIIFPASDTFIIGSREDLLHARGDLIYNPSQSIVKALKETAESLVAKAREFHDEKRIVTIYVEVFGGNVHKKSKNYTSRLELSCRGFDISIIDNYEVLLERPLDSISLWRENGGQPYLNASVLPLAMEKLGIDMAPDLFKMDGEGLPKTLEESYAFLRKELPKTRCLLDEGALGEAEGIVVRNHDRTKIAKIRFEDYERTLRRSQR